MISRRSFWTLKYFNGLLANSNGNIGPWLGVCDKQRRPYASDSKFDPDKDNPQTKGRTVEPWPKQDPPPAPWRCECPQEPQPVNYDPYRIRVPETVVPPLPPSNAKRGAGVVWTGYQDPNYGQQGYQQGQQQGCQQGCQGQPGCQNQQPQEEKDEGILGTIKNWLGLKGKKDSDDPNRSNITGLEINYVRDQ